MKRKIQVDAALERGGVFRIPLLMLQHYETGALRLEYQRLVRSRRRNQWFHLNGVATAITRDQTLALVQRLLVERGLEP